MAERISEIVESRGKMHNPSTGSGGVLLGTAAAVGPRYDSPPSIGERIVTLASLTLTPLRLDAVTEPDPASPQVEVSGTAYLTQRAAWAGVPDDLPVEGAVAIYDVCAAASQTRALAPQGGVVYVLGAGHAGKLALASARDATGGGTVVAVDADGRAVERVLESRARRHRGDGGPARSTRGPRGGASRRRAPGGPDGGRRQRQRL